MTTSSPILRPARLEDLEAIAGIWHAGWREVHAGHVPAALAARRGLDDLRRSALQGLDSTVVATLGPVVAGFVRLHHDEVEHLYVSAVARGAGVAALLLAHAEASIALHSDTAWLAVVRANVRARRFYERHGWRDRGEFTHSARVDGETIEVATMRYEKPLR